MNEKIVVLEEISDALERAWLIIANADWDRQPPEWQEAAVRWRDEVWHPFLDVLYAKRDDDTTANVRLYIQDSVYRGRKIMERLEEGKINESN